MSFGIEQRPLPQPTADSRPYWDGLKEGRLLFQKCRDCHLVRHYPMPMCPNCHSMELDWVESSGKGTVESWTVAHHAFHPAFKGKLPYTLVTVEMQEGVRMCAALDTSDSPKISIGLDVLVVFEKVTDDVVIPAFRLA
jgi:uncharacterized OB-fold protein